MHQLIPAIRHDNERLHKSARQRAILPAERLGVRACLHQNKSISQAAALFRPREIIFKESLSACRKKRNPSFRFAPNETVRRDITVFGVCYLARKKNPS